MKCLETLEYKYFMVITYPENWNEVFQMTETMNILAAREYKIIRFLYLGVTAQP